MIVNVSGSGYPAGCDTVYIFFAGQRIGSAAADAGGGFQKNGLAVPGDVGAGAQQVTTSCGSTGDAIVQSASFSVNHTALHRTAFATSLTQPRQVVTSATRLLTSALIAAFLLLFIAFPSHLFNSTLEENYEEVKGWFSWLHKWGQRPATFSLRKQGWHLVAFLAACGVLYGLLDPSFGINRSSLLVIAATVLAMIIVTAVLEGTQMLTRRRDQGALRLLPGTIVVAAVCVLVSRVLHLQPGYCYGLIASAVFASEINERDDGRVLAIATFATLIVGVLAWIAWVPVSTAAGTAGAGTGTLLLDSVLVAVFVTAIGTVVFGLVPLRFMDGAKVWAWSRTGWVALFGTAVFALVHLLLRPGTGFVSASTGWALILVIAAFIGFGVLSTGFWAYFRFRRPEVAPAGLDPETAVDQLSSPL